LSQHQFYSNNNAYHKLAFLSHLRARCCGHSNETYCSVSVINKDWNGAKGIRCARKAELTPKPSHFSVSPPKLYPHWGDLEIVKESNGPKDLRDDNKGIESIFSALMLKSPQFLRTCSGITQSITHKNRMAPTKLTFCTARMVKPIVTSTTAAHAPKHQMGPFKFQTLVITSKLFWRSISHCVAAKASRSTTEEFCIMI
jgi:hypothetical protein